MVNWNMDDRIEKYPGSGDGIGARAERIELPISNRMRRMRVLSRLLDNSILLPGGYRIGLDPLIGLIPGFGDVVATSLSLYIVYEAALMGISKRVLARMLGNVLVETLVGSVPILGDLFDAAWKANARNMQMVEMNYHAALTERNPQKIFLIFGLFALGFLAMVFWLTVTVFKLVFSAFN